MPQIPELRDYAKLPLHDHNAWIMLWADALKRPDITIDELKALMPAELSVVLEDFVVGEQIDACGQSRQLIKVLLRLKYASMEAVEENWAAWRDEVANLTHCAGILSIANERSCDLKTAAVRCQ